MNFKRIFSRETFLESLRFSTDGSPLWYLIHFQKTTFKKKVALKIFSAAATESHGKYTKDISIPWPAVEASLMRKRHTQASHSNGSCWLYKNYPDTQYWFPSVRSYHNLQTVKKSISDQNYVCYDDQ